ncbi:MAG: hypothetical protein JWN96_4429 [Mycobacterium sp.]|nr:hypothetical protein [Mycobacterium sp.]
MQYPSRHPTAFISWAHRDPDWDNEQTGARRDFVLRLAAGLRASGIDVDVDQYHTSEQVDWTRWGPRRIGEVDTVLVVCSDAWRHAWEGTGDVTCNTGAAAEADVLRGMAARSRDALVQKVRLIVPPGAGVAQIPRGLDGVPRHVFAPNDALVVKETSFAELLRALTGQGATPMPDLGPLPVLPPDLTVVSEGPDTTSPEPEAPLGAVGEARAEHLRAQLDALPEPRGVEDEDSPWFHDWDRATRELQTLSSTDDGCSGQDRSTADPISPGPTFEPDEAGDPPRSTPTAGRSLRERLAAEQLDRLQAIVATFETWAEVADRTSLKNVLEVGTRIGLISDRGLRAPIWETKLHLRFASNANDGIVITVEEDAGTVLSRHPWPEGTDAIDLYRQLDEAMESTGEHLGPLLFNPIESIETTAEALAYAVKYRSQKLNMGSQYLTAVCEYVDGWYITAKVLLPRGNEYYFIAGDRYDEMDWEQHISDKGWDGIFEALRVARAMRRADVSRRQSPATVTLTEAEDTALVASYGPTEWVSRSGANGPEIVLRAAYGAPCPPRLGMHATRNAAARISGEDREAIVVDALDATQLNAALDSLQQTWHWTDSAGWEVLGGSGTSELTELRLRLDWPGQHLRQGFNAHAAVMTGWSPDLPHVPASRAVLVAIDITLNVLELDAQRNRAHMAYRSTPPPAPAALSLTELNSYLTLLRDSAVATVDALYERLIGSSTPTTGHLGLWFHSDGVELERVLDVRGLDRLPRASAVTRAHVARRWSAADLRRSDNITREFLEQLLERNDYRGVRVALDELGMDGT